MRHGVIRKEAEKRLQDNENLFRKNLQLKDVLRKKCLEFTLFDILNFLFSNIIPGGVPPC